MTMHPQNPTVLPVSVHDQATSRDELGFRPYVLALARFLTNQYTDPPLAVSIEGDWGSGKTSFMMQLKTEIVRLEGEQHKYLSSGQGRSRRKLGYERRKPLIVWFNAWRNDQDESVWAAFAQTFINQVTAQRFFLRRWWGHLRLLLLRFGWKQGLWDAFKSVFWPIVILGILVTVVVFSNIWGPELIDEILGTNNNQNVLDAVRLLGNGTTVSALLVLFFWMRKIIKNPLNINFVRQSNTVKYDKYIAFVERFHEDLGRIVEAYAGGRTVFVFIDDLDRCDVPKSADLMKAFNLMISGDPNLVFIIGMDREKVAAGIAVKYERLLPYIYSNREGYLSDGAARPVVTSSLEFGYEFIEKFIQLPFSIPRPAAEQFNHYLEMISSVRPAETSDQFSRRDRRFLGKAPLKFPQMLTSRRSHDRDTPPQPQKAFDDESTVQDEEPFTLGPDDQEVQQEEFYESYSLHIAEDYGTIGRIAQKLASALDYNPRRLKQFINLFRLRILIAGETGLFKGANGIPAITPEQIGKFAAISLKWPLLVNDAVRDTNLISQLQTDALETVGLDQMELREHIDRNPRTPMRAFNLWRRRQDLMFLLQTGLTGETANPDYNLTGVDLERLLRVSPQSTYYETFDPLAEHTDGAEAVPNITHPADEAEPNPTTLTLSESNVVPNQTVTVIGRGFSAGSRINGSNDASLISIGGNIDDLKASGNPSTISSKFNENVSVTTDNFGTWVATLVLPINATTTTPGIHQLTIKDNGGREGAADMIISERTLVLDPVESGEGSTVNITGSGYPADNAVLGADSTPSVSIIYSVGGTPHVVATLAPDAAGKIAGEFKVPLGPANPSTNSVLAVYTIPGTSTEIRTATVHYVVEPSLSFDRIDGLPGTIITIRGSGFKPFSTVTTLEIGDIDVRPSPVPATDAQGVFTALVIIPSLGAGSQWVSARVSNLLIAETFVVLPVEQT